MKGNMCMNKSLLQIISESISDYSPEKITSFQGPKGLVNGEVQDSSLETATQITYDGVIFELKPESVKLYCLDSRGKQTWRGIEFVHESFNLKVDVKYRELLINRQINEQIAVKEQARQQELNLKLNSVRSKLKNNSRLSINKGFTDNTYSVNILDVTDSEVESIAEMLREVKA
jgi:hypothetical protein